jgi:hypothetical protein
MDTTPDDNRTITIDCENFRMVLQWKIRELAANRCRAMLNARAKKDDVPQDRNYTVS